MDTGLDVIIKLTRAGEVWVESEGVTKTPPKQVDPYELARLFMKFFSVEGHQISMELPESCVHVQIFYDANNNDGAVLGSSFILFRPAQVRKVLFFDDEYTVPLPPLLFKYYLLANAKITSSCVFAVELSDPGLLRDDTMLYHFPYGENVYGDGRMCHGTNRLPEIKSPRQLSSLPEYFLQLPFTGGNRDIFEHMNGKPVFPSRLLEPFSCKYAWLKQGQLSYY